MEVIRCTYPLLHEEVYTATLPSGLTVKVVPRQEFAKSYAVFMTKYGSNDNTFVVPGMNESTTVPDGIAHFLEHQMFAKPWGDAFTKFSEWGANANAFTGWTNTAYLFSTTTHFSDCLNFLVDFVQDPYFTAQGTEKEKGIIEQEIRMYDDDPNWRVYFNLLSALYHQHPVRTDIAGTVESVQSITKELLEDCYKTFYHPSNMVLVAVGNVDPGEVIAAVDEVLQNKNLKSQCEIKRLYPNEPSEVRQAEVNQQLSVTVPLFALGFKDAVIGAKGAELFKQQITTDLILQALLGKSSEVYNELYNQGLVGRRFSFSYTCHTDHGYTIIQGESKDPAAVRERLMLAFAEAKQQGLREQDFERSRKVLYGEFLREMNVVESVANSIASYSFEGIDYLTYPEVLQSISLSDANTRLKGFVPEQAAFSTITGNGIADFAD